MALPTAPLGQLPNMNMPYARQTYEVGPKLWERALMQFLSGVATQAGQNAVNNAMSRDYADKPAGFFSKLGSGPVQNREQFERAQQQEFVRAQQERELGVKEKQYSREDELARWLQGRREGEGAAGRAASREEWQAKVDLAQRQAVADAQLRRELQAAENTARLGEIDRRGSIEGFLRGVPQASTPEEAALRRAQAENIQSEMEQRRQIMSMYGGQGMQAQPAGVRPTDADRQAARTLGGTGQYGPADQQKYTQAVEEYKARGYSPKDADALAQFLVLGILDTRRPPSQVPGLAPDELAQFLGRQ